MEGIMKNNIFGFSVLFIFYFCIFSCHANEPQNSKTEQSQCSVIGKWIFEEGDGCIYIFTFTDTECNTLFLGDDKVKTAEYEVDGGKIFTTTKDGIRHEWDYEFQDEDTLEINIETDQRYFIGRRVKNNVTTLNGVYRIVNGVGFIYSFEFIDSSNVKIEWATVHGEFIVDDSTYEINGTSVILSSDFFRRNLEIVSDSILLITGMPNGIIAVFERE
jgi:hypothetical protein